MIGTLRKNVKKLKTVHYLYLEHDYQENVSKLEDLRERDGGGGGV